ncbi:MAG: rod shape-determining protein MreD [Chloroflexota bacterium]|nr:rod shape-determining protein MreD [Chloroflexota bacterium]
MTKGTPRRIRLNRRDLTGVYLTAATLTLAVLVQATLLTRIRLGGASPNLLLVMVVCLSLIRGQSDGVVWGFAGGLGLDLVAGLPLGTSALALLITCPLTGLGKNSVFPGSLTLPALLVLAATPVFGWVVLLTKAALGLPVDWLASTLHIIGPEMALNGALAPVVYPVLRWLARQTRPAQMAW